MNKAVVVIIIAATADVLPALRAVAPLRTRPATTHRLKSGFTVHVLPVDLPEPVQLKLLKYCCSSDSISSQYAAPIVLEQYVRSLPAHVGDVMQADIVFVPFYPVTYGVFDGLASDIVAAQLLPTMAQLPNTTVLVFVLGHVDCFHSISHFFLNHIRSTHPRRIIALRSDMGDTTCGCYGRPYWGDGLENILIPYAVVQPLDFISQQVRSEAQFNKNTTLFFLGRCDYDARGSPSRTGGGSARVAQARR